MLSIQITINPRDFIKRFQKYDIKDVQSRLIKYAVPQMEAEAKKSATRLIYQSPPAKSGYKRTGFLRERIQGRFTGMQTGKVEAKAPYSIYVHEGTRFMPARPFMQDAVDNFEKVQTKILDLVEADLKKGLT